MALRKACCRVSSSIWRLVHPWIPFTLYRLLHCQTGRFPLLVVQFFRPKRPPHSLQNTLHVNTLLSLFDDVEQIEKENRLQTAIDVVREQFGFLAIQKETVLTEGSRNIERSKLIGGHSAGGLEGLK